MNTTIRNRVPGFFRPTTIITLLALLFGLCSGFQAKAAFPVNWILFSNFGGTGDNQSDARGLFFNADGTPCIDPSIHAQIFGDFFGTWQPLGLPVTMNNDVAGLYFAIAPDPKLGIQDNLVQDGWVSIKLLAWRGTAPSYESANTADKFFVWDGTNHVDAATFPFLNQVGTFVAPAQLDGMPAMQLGLGLAPTTNVLTSSLNPSTYGRAVP